MHGNVSLFVWLLICRFMLFKDGFVLKQVGQDQRPLTNLMGKICKFRKLFHFILQFSFFFNLIWSCCSRHFNRAFWVAEKCIEIYLILLGRFQNEFDSLQDFLMCLVRLSFRENIFPQLSHGNVSLFVWVLICLFMVR